MVLATYWAFQFTLTGSKSFETPLIPPNVNVRAYSTLTGFIPTGNGASAVSLIPFFVQGGVTQGQSGGAGGQLFLSSSPNVTQVWATYLVANATAFFVFIVDIFE